MTSTTTRRAVLAGIAAMPAISVPAVAAASSIAAAPSVNAAPLLDPDAELRRLWGLYRIELDAYTEAAAIHAPRRAALNRDMKPYHFSLNSCAEELADSLGWDAFHEVQTKAHKRLWRKHKVGGPWRTMNRHFSRAEALIEAIRSIEARTPFGVGVKLSALPLDPDDYDHGIAIRAALPDLDKLCGGAFADVLAAQS